MDAYSKVINWQTERRVLQTPEEEAIKGSGCISQLGKWDLEIWGQWS